MLERIWVCPFSRVPFFGLGLERIQPEQSQFEDFPLTHTPLRCWARLTLMILEERAGKPFGSEQRQTSPQVCLSKRIISNTFKGDITSNFKLIACSTTASPEHQVGTPHAGAPRLARACASRRSHRRAQTTSCRYMCVEGRLFGAIQRETKRIATIWGSSILLFGDKRVCVSFYT